MTKEKYYNKKEFAERIGISPALLYAKEKTGEFTPLIKNLYTEEQATNYLLQQEKGISVFTENIQSLIKKYSYSMYQISKETGISRSTLSRILSNQNSYYQREATVKKLAKFFGYTDDIRFLKLESLSYEMIPSYDFLLKKKPTFFKLDKSKNTSNLNVFGAIEFSSEKYPAFNDKIILFSIERPMLEDTVIIKDNNGNIYIGSVSELKRDTIEICEAFGTKQFSFPYEKVFGVIARVI